MEDLNKKLLISKTLYSIIKNDDKYTSEHSARVAVYMSRFCDKLGFDENQRTTAEIAGILHDVGKVFITNEVLNNPSKLSNLQFSIMKKHSEYGKDILSVIDGFKEIATISGSHHEKFDGTGYPLNLKEEEASVYSRMMTLCDSFDAMTIKRVYDNSIEEFDENGNKKLGRKSVNEALIDIDKNKGTQFDPNLSDSFIEMVNEYNGDFLYDINSKEILQKNSVLNDILQNSMSDINLNDLKAMSAKLNSLDTPKELENESQKCFFNDLLNYVEQNNLSLNDISNSISKIFVAVDTKIKETTKEQTNQLKKEDDYDNR